MRQEWQLSRNGLFWLLVSFVGSILLHIATLPLWITLLAFAAVGWRILHYRGRLPFPNSPVKLLFVVAISGGLLLQYASPLGLDPMLALFSAGYSLKLLEMHTKRDALLIIFLGYFISSVACLFSQQMGNFLLVILCFLLATTALNAVSQSRARPLDLKPIKLSLGAMLIALPLMLILFMVMPRLGSIWSVPGSQGQAVTGIGNTVSPGDFTKLSRSSKLAFRVEFDGPVPKPEELYWRGLVLSAFDGRAWSLAAFFGKDSPVMTTEQSAKLVEQRGEPLHYKMVMEPTYNRWLFTLPYAVSQDPAVLAIRDFRLASAAELQFRKSFQLTTWPDYSLEADNLDPQRKAIELKLPTGANPQTQRIAKQWANETPDPYQLIDRLLNEFNRQFVYTLEPPPLGKHSVDEFLWGTRRGFCEHFASSFAFFMRAAGVPARVVAGYQGGEVHPTEGFLTVRQYDAHAWAEVWIAGDGWVRIDPTAAVAPERIENGFDELFGEQDYLKDSPLSLMRFKNFGLVNWLRLKLDSLDYLWATWVLGYEQQQYDLLAKLLGKVSAVRIALFLLAGALLTLLPVFILSLRDRLSRQIAPLDKYYLAFCRKAEGAGYKRGNGEGPMDFGVRLEKAFPDQQQSIAEITHLYLSMRYGQAEIENLMMLKKAIRSIRF